MRSVMVQFSEEQIRRLDAEAARLGVSRASVVRSVVDNSLQPCIDESVAAAYARAYPERTFGTDEWGSLDAWHTSAARSRAPANGAPANGAPANADEGGW